VLYDREVELELREELDLVQARVREVAREKETALEVICDHENTIAKFRTFVNQVGTVPTRYFFSLMDCSIRFF